LWFGRRRQVVFFFCGAFGIRGASRIRPKSLLSMRGGGNRRLSWDAFELICAHKASPNVRQAVSGA
ncbi:MAG TPA: hypothetical protein PLM33_08660, partial [Acidobacteriota bacterium]|nr:hypothetical protein [Acidobacteriota bacterium]